MAESSPTKKEFAENNLKFDEYSGKIFKWVENTVGKETIARYEQFVLFPQYFQKFVLQTCKNKSLFGKGLYLSQISMFYWSEVQII